MTGTPNEKASSCENLNIYIYISRSADWSWNAFSCRNKKPTHLTWSEYDDHYGLTSPCSTVLWGGNTSDDYDDHLVWPIHVPRRCEPLITPHLSLWGNARTRATFPTHKKSHFHIHVRNHSYHSTNRQCWIMLDLWIVAQPQTNLSELNFLWIKSSTRIAAINAIWTNVRSAAVQLRANWKCTLLNIGRPRAPRFQRHARKENESPML